jgi:transcriptional regulator with XRE-family HTH domain
MPAVSKRMPTGKLHKRFCENVRTLRKELGLTQEEAAKRCKMTQPQYCDIENGRFPPMPDTAERIGKGLGIDAGELFIERQTAGV